MKKVFFYIFRKFWIIAVVLCLLGLSYCIIDFLKPYSISIITNIERIETTKTSKSFYFRDKTQKRYIVTSAGEYVLVQDSQEVFTEPKKIAVLYIATGRYISFWKDFYKSAEKNFLPRHKKTYFLFTDDEALPVSDNVVKIHQDQLPWPYITLKRYHFFMNIKDQLKDFDYIFFFNANIVVKNPVNEEVFPSKEQGFMVQLHPGYYLANKKRYPYERRIKSACGVARNEGLFYVIGAFNGFRKDSYLDIFSALKKMIDEDLEQGITPVWHDESALNKYLIEKMKINKQPLILLPDYLIPEVSFSNMDEFRPTMKQMILEKELHGGRKWFRGGVKKEQ